MVIGLGLALLVSQITWGQRGIRTIMMFPMMFSPILVGFLFKYLLNDSIGFVNNALYSLGLVNDPIPWLVDGTLANISIIVAEIWMSTSVFAILLLAGLMAMPKEPVEAARVDGCNPWQVFRHITLPLIRHGLLGSWLLVFMIFEREYSTGVYLLAPGTEVIGAELVSLWQGGAIDVVAALSLINIVLVLIGLAFALRFGVKVRD